MTFETDNTLSVWLVHGQYPKTLCLSAADVIKLKIKVTVMKQDRGTDVLDLGTQSLSFDQQVIKAGTDGWAHVCGTLFGGTTSCRELEAKGFVSETRGTVLLRYEIDVL